MLKYVPLDLMLDDPIGLTNNAFPSNLFHIILLKQKEFTFAPPNPPCNLPSNETLYVTEWTHRHK
jgi:hypothetical protein